ncbi:ABC transporter permease [Jeotgalibaca sp. MA1X17-3]|uniref:ABC transporter permease n=1 Tax=Jeotgalibaca sp. MA1X17-3 TaxID=2908211 RepID=UPI001F25A303|nr:ABC transporter permease [Jeotgalibaca sp. MA1X17-3]UJF16382.1 ABC transporter permease [Jeotgalibaca sp. MA1X17-3]
MELEKSWINRWSETIRYYYEKAYQTKSWRIGLFVFGFLFQLIVYFSHLNHQKKSGGKNIRQQMEQQFIESGRAENLKNQLKQQEEQKIKFLNQKHSSSHIQRQVDKLYEKESNKEIKKMVDACYEDSKTGAQSYLQTTLKWLSTSGGILLSFILAWPMYLFLLVVSLPTLNYLINRLLMMFFVIIGVTFIVFTLLYFSPSDPATNILGNQATPQQVENFRQLHGLNESYFVQLGKTIKGIFTFDLGNAYAGNERVVTTILRRFPVTLKLTLYALGLSVAVALPAGIYAAVKANTTFDQLFMLIALLGISIPSFWQGLIFILTFSINLGWLPATYSSAKAISLLMPAVVLGTGLMASVARMTRSSTLEVINEDYILTARAKGLSKSRVILRHAVPNALIPIITVIGLQFGGMLGGSSVTEKVFTINGIGSYIVDKQFIPDIPSVMGGVIYIAIILSIVNVFVDLLYSFLDPRIRSRVKNGK